MKRGCLAAGAIAGAALGLLLVRAVHEAREAARRSQCLGNLAWIAVALHNYHSEFGSFPAGTVPNPALPPGRRLSWTILDMPWLVASGAHYDPDRSRAWDEPPNWPIRVTVDPNVTFVGGIPQDVAGFATCPDNPDGRISPRGFPLNYVGVAGVGPDAPTLPTGHPRAGVFGYDRATRLDQIKDGASETLLLLETARDARSWTAGGPSSVRGVDPADVGAGPSAATTRAAPTPPSPTAPSGSSATRSTPASWRRSRRSPAARRSPTVGIASGAYRPWAS